MKSCPACQHPLEISDALFCSFCGASLYPAEPSNPGAQSPNLTPALTISPTPPSRTYIPPPPSGPLPNYGSPPPAGPFPSPTVPASPSPLPAPGRIYGAGAIPGSPPSPPMQTSSLEPEEKIDARLRLTVSYPWMVRNILLIHLIGLVGLVPPWLYFLANPYYYHYYGNGNYDYGGCYQILQCEGAAGGSGMYLFTNVLAGVFWSLGGIFLLFTIAQAIILISKMRRWGWLVELIILLFAFYYPILGLWAFAIWGPKTRRRR